MNLIIENDKGKEIEFCDYMIMKRNEKEISFLIRGKKLKESFFTETLLFTWGWVGYDDGDVRCIKGGEICCTERCDGSNSFLHEDQFILTVTKLT